MGSLGIYLGAGEVRSFPGHNLQAEDMKGCRITEERRHLQYILRHVIGGDEHRTAFTWLPAAQISFGVYMAFHLVVGLD